MARTKKTRGSLPPFVFSVKARGKEYFYYQPHRGTVRREARISITGEPYDKEGMPCAEWWVAYRKLAGEEPQTVKAGTFTALIEAYKQSPEWLELSARTKGLWGPLLGKIEKSWGGLKVRNLEARHVLALRDAHAAKPGAANNLIRALSSMMAWSVPRGWRDNNPCTGLRKLKGGEGYGPWTWGQIQHFRDNAKQELWWAAALALYTGQRQGDCLSMRWANITGDVIAVKQSKTGKRLNIPVHRDLKVVLSAIPKRSLTVLSNTREKPWTIDGFKTSWAKELARPEMTPLRGLVYHGLRKSAVVFLLEAGCTGAEVAAITGQSMKMVEHYAQRVNQQKLAASAVLKWEASS